MLLPHSEISIVNKYDGYLTLSCYENKYTIGFIPLLNTSVAPVIEIHELHVFTIISLFNQGNSMVLGCLTVDGVETQGARSAEVRLLTGFCGNIAVSAPRMLKLLGLLILTILQIPYLQHTDISYWGNCTGQPGNHTRGSRGNMCDSGVPKMAFAIKSRHRLLWQSAKASCIWWAPVVPNVMIVNRMIETGNIYIDDLTEDCGNSDVLTIEWLESRNTSSMSNSR